MNSAGGLHVDSGIPLTKSHQIPDSEVGRLRRVMSAMTCGDSFLYKGHPHSPYCAARGVGIKITTRKVSGEGVRVWRVQ